MREIWLKITYTSGARIYSLLAGIVSLALTARLLGPAGRGTLATVTTWVSLFGVMGGLSLGNVVMHRAATLREERWLGSTLGSLILMTAAITAAGWAVAFAMRFGGGHAFKGLSNTVLIAGFCALPFVIWEQYGSSLLIALDRTDIYNKAQVFARTASLIALPIALWLKRDVVSVLIVTLGAQALIALAGGGYLFSRADSRISPDRATLKSLVTGGAKLHLAALSAFMLTSSDILMVNHYYGAVKTGYYQLAVQLLGVVLMIPQATAMIVMGRIVSGGADDAWPTQRKVVLTLTGLMVGLAVVVSLLAPFIVPLVVGGKFGPSIGVFRLMLVASVAMAFNTAMVPQWVARGLFWQCSVFSIASGAANLIGNYLLIPRYGMYGSVWSTIISFYGITTVPQILMMYWLDRRVARGPNEIAPAIVETSLTESTV